MKSTVILLTENNGLYWQSCPLRELSGDKPAYQQGIDIRGLTLYGSIVRIVEHQLVDQFFFAPIKLAALINRP
jgi:hypothetical protein